MLTEMKGIVVDFGPVRAVDHVDLTVREGEILGLLGENGAGKSTLMNVLAGTFAPTQGEIFLDGKRVRFPNAMAAMNSGIRFIHQELNLCPDLRVFENMYLAQEIRGKGPLLDHRAMAARCAGVFERMGVEIDPMATVDELQAAEKQMVEIARALLFESRLIIMDEPTTALTNREIEKLFVIMRQLKEQGVSFIYISHKMPEIFEICDAYTVLRDGRFVGSGKIADIDEHDVTQMMIGRSLADDEFAGKPYTGTDEVLVRAQGLGGDGFEDVSFALHRGEILAFTGLQSSGRDQLADALFGVIPHTGELTVKGKVMAREGIGRALASGVAMVPRDRKLRGIHNDLSIQDNLSMGFVNTKLRRLLISPRQERSRYERERERLAIKAANPADDITSLSGGNQQKVILGKWLETDADVLIFDNPTQGIDVGTKFEIYRLLIRLAAQGKAILVFSSEFPEIHKVADACCVMYKGRVAARLARENMTEKNMMAYATGLAIEES